MSGRGGALGSITTAPLKLFHGGKSWEGPLKLTGGRKGKVEHGPGFYMTTSFDTARSYAKGVQRVFELLVEPDLRWLHDVRLPLATLVEFVRSTPGLKNAKRVEQELRLFAARSSRDLLGAAVVENLMAEFSNPYGAVGQSLAQFYLAHGIDATLTQQSGESWVILYNTDKVRSWRRVVGDQPNSPRIAP